MKTTNKKISFYTRRINNTYVRSAVYATALCPSVRLSVCPVTFVYSIEKAEPLKLVNILPGIL